VKYILFFKTCGQENGNSWVVYNLECCGVDAIVKNKLDGSCLHFIEKRRQVRIKDLLLCLVMRRTAFMKIDRGFGRDGQSMLISAVY
jgi:hypothetical protein